jgi:spore photoproduct lyase
VAPVTLVSMTEQSSKPLSPDQLLEVTRIYAEPAAAALPRGQQILARWPAAGMVEVASHWQIPELHGNEAMLPGGCGSSAKPSCWE